jgi:hypothetical protein
LNPDRLVDVAGIDTHVALSWIRSNGAAAGHESTDDRLPIGHCRTIACPSEQKFYDNGGDSARASSSRIRGSRLEKNPPTPRQGTGRPRFCPSGSCTARACTGSCSTVAC